MQSIVYTQNACNVELKSSLIAIKQKKLEKESACPRKESPRAPPHFFLGESPFRQNFKNAFQR